LIWQASGTSRLQRCLPTMLYEFSRQRQLRHEYKSLLRIELRLHTLISFATMPAAALCRHVIYALPFLFFRQHTYNVSRTGFTPESLCLIWRQDISIRVIYFLVHAVSRHMLFRSRGRRRGEEVKREVCLLPMKREDI